MRGRVIGPLGNRERKRLAALQQDGRKANAYCCRDPARGQTGAGASRRKSMYPSTGESTPPPMGDTRTRIRQTLGRWQRRSVERFAEAVVAALAGNRRIRRTMLRKLSADYLDPRALSFAQFDDHGFFVNPRDQTISFDLLCGRPWQRAEFLAALGLLDDVGALRDGGRFLDVGANIGTQTVYALLTGRFAGGVAIEAEPRNYGLLERNIAYNGLEGCVRALHAAAADAEGPVTLRINRRNGGGHSAQPGRLRSATETVTVRGAPVDTLLQEAGVATDAVTLAWIDVEGFERIVLEGMQALRAASVPLVFEFSAGAEGADGWARVREMLRPHYDACAAIDDPASGWTPLEAFEPVGPQVDLVVCRLGKDNGP